jgi:hypothetical protein
VRKLLFYKSLIKISLHLSFNNFANATYVKCSLRQELVVVVRRAPEGVPDLVRVHVDPEVRPDFLLEREHLVALCVPQQGARLLGTRRAETASVHVPASICNQVSSQVKRVAYGERLQALFTFSPEQRSEVLHADVLHVDCLRAVA